MISGKSVVGHPVITLAGGKQLHTVKDLIYDPQANVVRALLIANGGWFSDAKVAMLHDVYSIGHDAVIIQSDRAIVDASKIPQPFTRLTKGDQYLTPTKIVTEAGDELGTISDIYFDDETGEIKEFEVSQGALASLQNGKKRIPVSDILTVGKDATIVRNQDSTEQTTQGTAEYYQTQEPDNSPVEETKDQEEKIEPQQVASAQEHPTTQNSEEQQETVQPNQNVADYQLTSAPVGPTDESTEEKTREEQNRQEVTQPQPYATHSDEDYLLAETRAKQTPHSDEDNEPNLHDPFTEYEKLQISYAENYNTPQYGSLGGVASADNNTPKKERNFEVLEKITGREE